MIKGRIYLKFITRKLSNVTKEDKKLYYENRGDFKKYLAELNFDIIIINATEFEARFVKDLIEDLLNEINNTGKYHSFIFDSSYNFRRYKSG